MTVKRRNTTGIICHLHIRQNTCMYVIFVMPSQLAKDDDDNEDDDDDDDDGTDDDDVLDNKRSVYLTFRRQLNYPSFHDDHVAMPLSRRAILSS